MNKREHRTSETEPKQVYVGRTTDLRARYSDHNAGRTPHPSKYRPWGLVCYHAFADERRASEFEAYLKSGSGRAFRTRHFGA
jgi:predicted GIY-YIG superfamily endonuclease